MGQGSGRCLAAAGVWARAGLGLDWGKSAGKPVQVVGRIHFHVVLEPGAWLLSGAGQKLSQQLDVTLSSLPSGLPTQCHQSQLGDQTLEQI